MTPQQAADWIEGEVRRVGCLDHATVIGHLINIDPALVEYNDQGNPKIAKAVQRAFGKRNGNDIVWSRSSFHWRLREPGDEPGRLVS